VFSAQEGAGKIVASKAGYESSVREVNVQPNQYRPGGNENPGGNLTEVIMLIIVLVTIVVVVWIFTYATERKRIEKLAGRIQKHREDHKERHKREHMV
jgi:uncharacterized membrane protein